MEIKTIKAIQNTSRRVGEDVPLTRFTSNRNAAAIQNSSHAKSATLLATGFLAVSISLLAIRFLAAVKIDVMATLTVLATAVVTMMVINVLLSMLNKTKAK